MPIFLVRVQIPGRETIRIDLTEKIVSFEYQDCESKADRIKLVVDNYDLANFDDPIWKKGNIIEATWGYPEDLAPVRLCVIESVKGFQQLTIEALALSIMLAKVTRSRVFEGQTASEIASRIAGEWGYGAESQHVERSNTVLSTMTQARQTDADFLRKLARREGFEFYTDFDGFHFHSRNLQQRALRTLTWFTDPGQGDILSVSVENDITAKPGRVRRQGRSPEERTDQNAASDDAALPHDPVLSPVAETFPPGTSQQLIDTFNESLRRHRAEIPPGSSTLPADYEAIAETMAAANARGWTGAQTTGQAAYSTPATPQTFVNWFESQPPVITEATLLNEARGACTTGFQDLAYGSEATFLGAMVDTATERRRARAAQRRVQQTTVQMSLTIIGDPKIIAKSVLDIRGLGRRLSGLYYVTEATHKITPGSYQTTIKCFCDGTQGYRRPGIPEVAPASRAAAAAATTPPAGQQDPGALVPTTVPGTPLSPQDFVVWMENRGRTDPNAMSPEDMMEQFGEGGEGGEGG